MSFVEPQQLEDAPADPTLQGKIERHYKWGDMTVHEVHYIRADYAKHAPSKALKDPEIYDPMRQGAI